MEVFDHKGKSDKSPLVRWIFSKLLCNFKQTQPLYRLLGSFTRRWVLFLEFEQLLEQGNNDRVDVDLLILNGNSTGLGVEVVQ